MDATEKLKELFETNFENFTGEIDLIEKDENFIVTIKGYDGMVMINYDYAQILLRNMFFERPYKINYITPVNTSNIVDKGYFNSKDKYEDDNFILEDLLRDIYTDTYRLAGIYGDTKVISKFMKFLEEEIDNA